MKTLSLTQPFAAYLAGVLHGDGWCTRLSIGLRCKDHDFALAFSSALRETTGASVPPRRDERGYWLVRARNKTGRFNQLKQYDPQTDEERAAWVRGMFDSEGNAQLRRNGVSENSFGRRVAFYSTAPMTLDIVALLLDVLGISSRRGVMRASTGHKGKKLVEYLEVRGSRENYERFASLVGSNIERKNSILLAIPESYRSDMGECYRRAQLLGAATKNRRRETIVIPHLVGLIRELIDAGVKPTERRCANLPGYTSIQGRHLSHTALVMMARETLSAA